MLDGTVLEGQHVDVLMLDTTYALPRYTFPPQQDAINSMAQVRQARWAVQQLGSSMPGWLAACLCCVPVAALAASPRRCPLLRRPCMRR